MLGEYVWRNLAAVMMDRGGDRHTTTKDFANDWGISLLLNPSYKKQIMLTKFLKWKQEWVDSVMDHFMSSFSHYRDNAFYVSNTKPIITTSVLEPEGEYFSYMKRQKTDTADLGEEYTRYLVNSNYRYTLMNHKQYFVILEGKSV